MEFLPGLVVIGQEWRLGGPALPTDPPENGATASSTGPTILSSNHSVAHLPSPGTPDEGIPLAGEKKVQDQNSPLPEYREREQDRRSRELCGMTREREKCAELSRFGFIALIPDIDGGLGGIEDDLRRLLQSSGVAPLLIICMSRSSLATIRRVGNGMARDLVPDIVVFDDSFTDRHVPFGAFTARLALYEHWNRPGKTTFHSTTYQPNTVSSLHFMRCLNRQTPCSTHQSPATCDASNRTRNYAASYSVGSTAGRDRRDACCRVRRGWRPGLGRLRICLRSQDLRRRQRRRLQRPRA